MISAILAHWPVNCRRKFERPACTMHTVLRDATPQNNAFFSEQLTSPTIVAQMNCTPPTLHRDHFRLHDLVTVAAGRSSMKANYSGFGYCRHFKHLSIVCSATPLLTMAGLNRRILQPIIAAWFNFSMSASWVCRPTATARPFFPITAILFPPSTSINSLCSGIAKSALKRLDSQNRYSG